MCRGNSLLLQTAKGAFEDATALSGAGRAGWNWSVAAADLDNDGSLDLYATNGMWDDGRAHDRELEFWWETLAYWDDYIAMKKTFDRKGAGVQGIERDAYFVNRGPGASPLFEERAFLDGLDLQTNGRAVVAFDANGDGALDLYVRSVQAPEALFLGSRKNPGRRALPQAPPRGHAREGQRGRARRAGHGDAARRARARPGERLRERLSRDGQPHRPSRARRRHANREARRALAVGLRAGPRARRPSSTGPSRSTSRRPPYNPRVNESLPSMEPSYDVVVIGGAISGASTAVLLRRRMPDLKVLVVEKSAAFDWKVGESTVEISAYFLTRELKLYDHLSREQLPKQAFRYWFNNEKVSCLREASETGPDAARPHALLPDRPAEARRARDLARGEGRLRRVAAREGRGRRPERRGREHARRREGRRHARRPSAASGSWTRRAGRRCSRGSAAA